MVKRYFISLLIFLPVLAVYLVGGLWLMGNVNALLGIIVMVVGIGVATFFLTRMIASPTKADRNLEQTGIEADAQITGVKDLRMTFNDLDYGVRLSLSVQPANGPSFAASLEMVVSRVQIPPVGAWLKVKYDPANPSHVVMVGDTISVGGPVGGADVAPAAGAPMIDPNQVVELMKQNGLDQAVASGQSLIASPTMDAETATALLQKAEEQLQELRQTGVTAKAAVIEVHPLNIFVNGNNQGTRITLTVMPDNGAPYSAEATGVISERSWPHYQAGKILQVKVDPNKPSRVSFYKSEADA
jgi:hypothetical protein